PHLGHRPDQQAVGGGVHGLLDADREVRQGAVEHGVALDRAGDLEAAEQPDQGAGRVPKRSARSCWSSASTFRQKWPASSAASAARDIPYRATSMVGGS